MSETTMRPNPRLGLDPAAVPRPVLAAIRAKNASWLNIFGTGEASRGRHCHSTLSLTVVGCHSLGIHILVLLSLLSFPQSKNQNDNVALG